MTAVLEAAYAPGVEAVGDDWVVTPASCGPTWSKDPLAFPGASLTEFDPEGYILPELTLGWQIIRWIEDNLLSDDTDENDNPLPFKLTNEQMRFILWMYALDPGDEYREATGTFLFREIVLQRLKGWGKDPLAACIAAVEFVGPCRFAGWAAVDMPDKDLEIGDPVGKPHPRSWIQIAATSKDQTKNTMMLFLGLFTPECLAEHSIDLGKEIIYAYHGAKRIEVVTSSPRSLEGNRPTLVIKNETHHWQANNDGIAMADAIERNATKAKGGAARTLAITNAYEPSVDSVARRERIAWEAGESGDAFRTDTMYDSLEAPADALLAPKFTPDGAKISDLEPEEQLAWTEKYLTRVLDAVCGDAWWLDIPGLIKSILNPKNAPSRSRRFWYNQIVASEDAWAAPAAIKAAVNPFVKERRLELDRDSRGVLEAGWIPHPDEPIVAFFDGSKSDDSTGIIGTRLSDGYQFVIGVWQKPKGKAGETWTAPREAVDARVAEMFRRFNVVAFWGDPSHTKDDEDGTRYWDGLFDKWMREYRDKLDPKHWAVKSGHSMHAIMFDMTSTERLKIFVGAADEYIEALERLNDIEEFDPEFQIDGHPAFLNHLENARKCPTAWGTSLMKDGRESANKIDLAVCAVGSRMLARIVMNKGVEEKEEPGDVWGFGF